MRAVHVLLLLALVCQALATNNPFLSRVSKGDDDDGDDDDRSGSFGQAFRGKSSDDDDDDDDDSGKSRRPFQRRDCGGPRQKCCPNSQCAGTLRCLTPGDNDWVGMEPRCLPVKARGRCGLDGSQCCRRRCIQGLSCVKGRMCRKPSDKMLPPNVAGTTTAQLTGWIKVIVLARGGKCYTRVFSEINTSVMTFGEGTFGETFGELSALGECEAGASGVAIGYIRAEVMGTATLTSDGECISNTTGDLQIGGKVKGTGVSVGLGADTGVEVGCLKRRLLLSDFL